jgi:hypothetical protein
MGQKCTVCSHPDAFAINEALVIERRSLRNIAKQFDVNYQAVNRHKQHIPHLLVQASRSMEIAEADTLIDRLEDLQRRTLAILEASEETKEHTTALAAIREARRNLEVIGEVTKELDRTPTFNLILMPEWIELRTKLLYALDAYPEARGSVLRALEDGGNG